MLRRLPRLTLVVAALATLPGCGEETSDVSDGEAAQRASRIAEDTRRLAGQVARTGRALLEDPAARDDARDRLDELEEQARERAAAARALPPGTSARAQVREAAQGVAEAAARLRRLDPDTRSRQIEEAREGLRRAEDRLATAADRLRAELPAEARRALDGLREQIPDLP